MSQVKQEDVDYDPVAAALAPLLQASEGLPPPMPDTIKEEATAEDSNATAAEDVMYLQVKEEDGAEGGESWIVLPNSLFQSAENGATQSWYATYGEDGTLHVQTDAIPEQQQQQEVPSDLLVAEADIKPVPPPTTRPAEVTPTLIRCAFAKCRQVFSTLAALSEHNKTHANFVRRKHNCPLPLCESSFTSLDKLQEHMITHGLKPYACTFEHCKESYRTKADLDYHQRKNPAHKPQNARKKPTAVSRPVTVSTAIGEPPTIPAVVHQAASPIDVLPVPVPTQPQQKSGIPPVNDQALASGEQQANSESVQKVASRVIYLVRQPNKPLIPYRLIAPSSFSSSSKPPPPISVLVQGEEHSAEPVFSSTTTTTDST